MHKRIVVKIGTKALSKENGRIDESVLGDLVNQIAQIKKGGAQVILVTSGAVGSGRSLLKLSGKTETIPDKQVFAAIGQVKLMATYSKLLSKLGFLCAQVLVTKEDFRDKEHYQNMRNCFLNMLRDNVIPIVNENDVVAIRELVFTDNDELAGLIAKQLKADAVIILSSVDGMLDNNLKVIPEISYKDIASAQKYVTKNKTASGRGGMVSKFATAKKLAALGATVYIANGKKRGVLLDILSGRQVGTKFTSR